jgi:hypothetical protein
MPNEWIRKNINPKLVARYEKELAKLRGEQGSSGHIVENIKKMNAEVEKIETEEEIRAKAFAEDEEDERRFQEQRKQEKQNKGKQ